jgi:hypothetical protein
VVERLKHLLLQDPPLEVPRHLPVFRRGWGLKATQVGELFSVPLPRWAVRVADQEVLEAQTSQLRLQVVLDGTLSYRHHRTGHPARLLEEGTLPVVAEDFLEVPRRPLEAAVRVPQGPPGQARQTREEVAVPEAHPAADLPVALAGPESLSSSTQSKETESIWHTLRRSITTTRLCVSQL